jgi:hexosaminidase
MVGIALFCLMANIAASGPPLIPAPAEARFEEGRLPLDRNLKIFLPAWPQPRVADIAAILREGLRDQAGVEASVQALWAGSAAGGIALSLDPRAFPGEPEAYRIEVGRFAAITASDPRGLLWGVQTFLQCLEPSGPGRAVRRMTITDRPRRPWRGLMLDPVRSFLDLDFVRRTIRVMSAYKLNVLHLHLIDDEAWRFESRVWPKCNRPGEPLYTQEELRALVAFARRYGVEIVPEFDVPGHSMTAVAAYPELDCERRPRPMNEAIFCAGRPFTHEFVDRLVAEASEVFPSEFIHLGADEPYAIKRWADCPDCRARMAKEGVATVDALYHVFVRDLEAIAKRHGKRLIVWNDAIRPGVEPMPPRDILIDAWYDFRVVGPLAEAGYTLLNSSQGPLYLTSFGLGEGLPLAAVLAWNATRFPDPPAEMGAAALNYRALSPKATILGGHASAWATEQSLVERRLYPRLLAMAEELWAEGRSGAEPSEFEARFLAGHADRLRRLGVPDDEGQSVETPFPGGSGAVLAPGSAAGGYLVTSRSYRDFRLSFEVRGAAPDGQMGVFLRCSAGLQKDAPPPGFLIAAAPPPGRVLSPAARLAEGWNRCEVVARGAVVSLTVNGVLAWSVVDPAPRSGPIVFLGMGPGHQFRNVGLRVLEVEQ